MSYFSLFCYFAAHKKFLLFPILIGVICFCVAWVMPKVYSTEIRLQVSEGSPSFNSGISSLLKSGGSSSGIGGSLASFLTSQSSLSASDMYFEILSGRDVALKTIEKFHLDTLYKKKAKELLLKKFAKDLKISEESSGVISCSFEAEDKEMAQSLLRFIVNEANTRYLELEKEKLSYSLKFLQESEKDMQDSIRNLVNELAQFYKDNNIIDLEGQMEITLTALAGYESQINNYKLSEMEQSNDNSESYELKKRRKLLEQKFKELRGKYREGYIPSENSLYINSDWAASKILYQKQREADLKMYQTLLEGISVQLLASQAQYLQQQPVIQIIQDAYLPDWRVRPKRAMWAIVGFMFSGFIVCLYLLYKGLVSGEIENKFDLQIKLQKLKLALFK